MEPVKFELGDRVRIIASGEVGIVTGCAKFLNSEDQVYLHYKAADGRATSCWWDNSLVEAV